METTNIPILPLRGATLFPEMSLQLEIGRDKSIKAVELAYDNDMYVFVVTQKDIDVTDPTFEDFYEIGTLAKVEHITLVKDPIIQVVFKGEEKAKILDVTEEDGYLSGNVEIIPEVLEMTEEAEGYMRNLVETFTDYGKINKKITNDTIFSILAVGNEAAIVNLMIAQIPLEVSKQQKLLEIKNMKEKIYYLTHILRREVEVSHWQKEIHHKVRTNLDKHQREYFLREQIKVLRQELGQGTEVEDEASEIIAKMEQLDLPQSVEEKLYNDIEKLKKMPINSHEITVLRSHIESILEMPWHIYTPENYNMKTAIKMLDEAHYSLEKVKDRILEYMAVQVLNQKSVTPIFCLVGPPGVGKTSIAQSIADVLGRNYVSIALGGVRDEAEIRGHRKTYIGAMAGRIAYALKSAQSNNPLILLDEIDKMGNDFKGNPSAALLEVLDPKQNSEFRDHYLEVPLDLSRVMFIATANTLSTVPKPLLDRMEIIEVSSYTEQEKYIIAQKYLVPKQLEAHGLNRKNCTIGEKSIRYIITYYTKEAGVRNLEREIGKVCRKVARELLEYNKSSKKVTTTTLRRYLGVPRYNYLPKDDNPQIGVARGLAWTSVGGDTLTIEVETITGKGALELTGNMGNVMKESAKAGLSYIKANHETLNIDIDKFRKSDVHIHIPEGAVPKDGPSAGTVMATAIISAFTGKKVRNDIAMTGEVTIRGRVLAIGGLKEKLLAAKRAGIYTIILPKSNEKDILSFEDDIIKGIKIIYVQTMDDVLKNVFAKDEENTNECN
ncbi:MAG: endopeptidase La [Epulopiscium sp. Nele67-Bin005]|nr:MAG: endopeptidase La [Epulopiscium sp. Nele67-Bin005]